MLHNRKLLQHLKLSYYFFLHLTNQSNSIAEPLTIRGTHLSFVHFKQTTVHFCPRWHSGYVPQLVRMLVEGAAFGLKYAIMVIFKYYKEVTFLEADITSDTDSLDKRMNQNI